MIMYDGLTFITKIGPFKMCDLQLSMYVNNYYECACGEQHLFTYDSEILCQGAWKLILECPNNKEYVTCVKLKSKFLVFGFSRFVTLFGTKLIKNKSSDFENTDKKDMPEEMKNSLILFHCVIKEHTGQV
jgi:hypothetical protein